MNPSPGAGARTSTENPFLFDTLLARIVNYVRRRSSRDTLRETHLNVPRMGFRAAIKETYRCRSSLSWTFVIADDTFRLVRHQIRQAFLGLRALIAANDICEEIKFVITALDKINKSSNT